MKAIELIEEVKNSNKPYSSLSNIQLRNELKDLATKFANAFYTIPLTKEEFYAIVYTAVNNSPSQWRKGQAVFNCVDTEFGLARTIQYNCHIDCFYNDDAIEEFMEKAYELYQETMEKL